MEGRWGLREWGGRWGLRVWRAGGGCVNGGGGGVGGAIQVLCLNLRSQVEAVLV